MKNLGEHRFFIELEVLYFAFFVLLLEVDTRPDSFLENVLELSACSKEDVKVITDLLISVHHLVLISFLALNFKH